MFNKLVVEVKKEMVIERGMVYVAVCEDGVERLVCFYANKSYKKDVAIAFDIERSEILHIGNDIKDIVSKFSSIKKYIGEPIVELLKSIDGFEDIKSGAVMFFMDKNNVLKQRRIMMGCGKMVTINPETRMISSRVRDNMADLLKGYNIQLVLNTVRA